MTSTIDETTQRKQTTPFLGKFTPCLSIKREDNSNNLKSCLRDLDLSRRSRMVHPHLHAPPSLPHAANPTEFTIPSVRAHARVNSEHLSYKLDNFMTQTSGPKAQNLDNFYQLSNGHEYYMKRLNKMGCSKLRKIFKPVIEDGKAYSLPKLTNNVFASSMTARKYLKNQKLPFHIQGLHKRSTTTHLAPPVLKSGRSSGQGHELSDKLHHIIFSADPSMNFSP
jgi:hypothetical protein